MGRSWQWEVEGTGLIVSTARKQSLMNAIAQLPSFIQFDLRECCYPQWVGFPTSINLIKIIPHGYAQKLVFSVDGGFIKLAIEINHHQQLLRVSLVLCTVKDFINNRAT